MNKHLASVTILSDDRHANATAMQKVMTDRGRLIRARLGVNLVPSCAAKCNGLIVLAVEGTLSEIKELTAAFNKLKSVKAKSTVITK